MAGSKASSPKRKAKQGENYTKARTAEAERLKASKGNNVAPGTFNGHSIGGYSLKKHGEAAATELALKTRPSSERREARRKNKVTPAPKRKPVTRAS